MNNYSINILGNATPTDFVATFSSIPNIGTFVRYNGNRYILTRVEANWGGGGNCDAVLVPNS